MFRVTFYILLVCLMTSTAVECMPWIIHPQISLPSAVDGVDIQCQKLGYFGACRNLLNNRDGQLGCLFLPCAHYTSQSRFYVDYPPRTTVADGTKCADQKVCDKGVCVAIGDRPMPTQNSRNSYYQCTPLDLPKKSDLNSRIVSKKT